MKKNQKGFTLVELIVVLVILAILAAILVPALLGYIDRAKGSQLLLNGKSVLTAAQAEASNCYGIANSTQTIDDFFGATNSKYIQSIKETADTPVGSGAIFTMKADKAVASKGNHDAWTVYEVVYHEGDKYIFFDGTSWEENLTKDEATGKLTKTTRYSFENAAPASPSNP